MAGTVFLASAFVAGITGTSAQEKQSSSRPQYQFKVGILPFADNTGSQGDNAGKTLSRAVQTEIVHSSKLMGRVLKLDEDTEPEDLDGEKAVEIGKAQKMDTVLTGTILEASSEESGKEGKGPSIFGQTLGGSAHLMRASVTLQGDLYDVVTGKLIESIRAKGKASQTKLGSDISTSIGDLSSDGGDVSEDSAIGKALHNAVADLVKHIAADEPKMTRFKGSAGD